jgi:hypothetical protein
MTGMLCHACYLPLFNLEIRVKRENERINKK